MFDVENPNDELSGQEPIREHWLQADTALTHRGTLDQIRKFASNWAVIGSLAFGELAASACSPSEQKAQVQVVAVPKYSTLPDEVKLNLDDTHDYLFHRQNLNSKLTQLMPNLEHLMNGYSDSGNHFGWLKKHQAEVAQLSERITETRSIVQAESEMPMFSSAENHLRQTARSLEDLQESLKNQTSEWQIANARVSQSSPGYSKAMTASYELKELSKALEWDIQKLQPAVTASKVTSTFADILSAQNALELLASDVSNQPGFILSEHPERMAQLRLTLDRSAMTAEQASKDQFFSNIQGELADLSTTLKDISKTLAPENSYKYWTTAQSTSSGQVAMVIEGRDLARALTRDFERELTSVGVLADKQAQPSGGRSYAQTHSSDANSGNSNFLLWYWVGRMNGAYYSPPMRFDHYSSGDRLRASTDFRSYHQAQDKSKETNRGSPIYTPRPTTVAGSGYSHSDAKSGVSRGGIGKSGSGSGIHSFGG